VEVGCACKVVAGRIGYCDPDGDYFGCIAIVAESGIDWKHWVLADGFLTSRVLSGIGGRVDWAQRAYGDVADWGYGIDAGQCPDLVHAAVRVGGVEEPDFLIVDRLYREGHPAVDSVWRVGELNLGPGGEVLSVVVGVFSEQDIVLGRLADDHDSVPEEPDCAVSILHKCRVSIRRSGAYYLTIWTPRGPVVCLQI